jgi:hypothetical protein
MMKRNMGTADRIVRATLGVGIIGAGIAFQSWLGLIGIVPLVTALAGRCPAYLPFGISTCRRTA